MKIVFTTSGMDLSAPLDGRFGRAPKFLVYDLQSDTFEVLDNRQNASASQGAGIQSAETIARLGATALITGHCGPKAFRVLQAAGVKLFTCDAGSLAETLELYRAGKLSELSDANAGGHGA